jgi:hypothetical protein
MMSTACLNTLRYLASPARPSNCRQTPPPSVCALACPPSNTHIHRGLAAQQPWARAVSAAD